MSLLLPTQRAFNPSQFVGLSGSSLARGLVYASGADFLINQARKGDGTRVGGNVVTTPQGRMLRLNGTSEYVKLGTTVGGVNLFADANNTWSIVVQVRQLVTNANGVLVARSAGDSGATNQIQLYLESGYATTNIRGSYQTAGSQIGLNPNQITLTWDGTTAYLHRELHVTGTRTVGTAAEESAETICIGARNDGASAFLSGDIGYVLIYNRAISRDEHIAILKNPGSVFAPQPRRIWIPSAGGTPAELAGSAQAQATATGALSTGIPFAGQAAAVVAAAGVLTSQIQLSGTALAQAEASAALSSGLELSGSAVSVSFADGTLTTQIKLDGSALAQATATGALDSSISLAGDASALAGATGALTTSGGGFSYTLEEIADAVWAKVLP